MSLHNLANTIEQELSESFSWFERRGKIDESGGSWIFENKKLSVSGFISCEDNSEDIDIPTVSLAIMVFDLTDFTREQILGLFEKNISFWQANLISVTIDSLEKLLLGRRSHVNHFYLKTLEDHIKDLMEQASLFLNNYFAMVMVKDGDKWLNEGEYKKAN